MSHRNNRNRFLRSASTPYTRVTLADGTDATPHDTMGGDIVSANGKIVERSDTRGIRRFHSNTRGVTNASYGTASRKQ